MSSLFDITVSLALLFLLAPLILIVALLVWINLGRPLLFRQTRPGLHGTPFVLIKFRTMRPPAATEGLEGDAQRLGRFGRLLRAMSLDELPSLWNVLRGDMSIIGPRPLLMEYLPRAYKLGAKDPLAREKVHYAATIAGMAFASVWQRWSGLE